MDKENSPLYLLEDMEECVLCYLFFEGPIDIENLRMQEAQNSLLRIGFIQQVHGYSALTHSGVIVASNLFGDIKRKAGVNALTAIAAWQKHCLDKGEAHKSSEAEMAYETIKFEHKGETKTVSFVHPQNMKFEDVSTEEWRRYEWEGFSFEIKCPLRLHVSKSGGHRIFAADGCHYVPAGWMHIEWSTRAGKPHFTF